MPGGPLDALADLVVLDLSDSIAGSYCTKLLADAGASVVKAEPPAGHPLRAWSTSASVGSDGDPDGALFRYLATGQGSVVADIWEPADRDRVLELAAASDVVVESFAPGFLDAHDLGLRELHSVNPSLTVVSIAPFGLDGPRSGEARGDFLLQALSGSLYNHGSYDRRPLMVGGGLGEWIAGAYAAAGALAARAGTALTGRGQRVDVSTLECLAVTFVSYPSVQASVPGGVRRRTTYDMVPGVEPCQDGFVGLTTLTAQQWHSFLAMIDRSDLGEDRTLDHPRGRAKRRDELLAAIHAWTGERTVTEIVERAATFRVPAAPVLSGATVADLDHLAARDLFDENPLGGFPHPRPPFRSSATPPRPVAPAPRLGDHDAAPPGRGRSPQGTASRRGDAPLPLEGIRVLDFTGFWAGPCATQYLATLGADVIKVESIQRPDAIRFSATAPTTDQWYEQGFLFLSANLNKRGITLNVADPRGRDLALALVARSDVVVENFSPRVMEKFDLTYEQLRAAREDVISIRMPGWGLEGPWRDRPGFATTMEQAAGMAWVTGYEGGLPMAPGLCDPLAGIHAAFAILAALEQRSTTGRGQQIELSMIDLAVNVAAEQVIEHAVYGHLMTRDGNHGPRAAPQGVYPCVGRDEWVALAVSTDAEWVALRSALGHPAWADDPSLARAEGRHAELRGSNVPAEPVVPAWSIDQDEQMEARGFWEEVDHPVVGTHRYPGWPMKLSDGPGQWYRSPAPLLGQHTAEVLGKELGMTPEELAALRDAGVIGDRPLGL
jgi:crotonobetainyl-CoA:carnitine CoA-transferase CaiB-like acyl-CoA transferase